MAGSATALRQIERQAKEARLRIWANYVNTAPQIAAKDKEFTATVLEVCTTILFITGIHLYYATILLCNHDKYICRWPILAIGL